MHELQQFIVDLENKNNIFTNSFSNKEALISSLKELDSVIGMNRVKTQIIKQIKTFVSTKAKNIYSEKDRKHCLLCGPPGCGKTTIAKILCKVWIAIGFIGGGNVPNKKLNSFNKLQDELVRRQKSELKEYKEKLKLCQKIVLNLGRVSTVSKRSISNIISIKSNIPHKLYSEIFNDLTGSNNIIEESTNLMRDINNIKEQTYKGMEVEIDKEMESTQEDLDLPFYIYNRNDVVSRYVGDTSHRCTKAMNDALGGVAFFDEAYNLCNDSGGMSDSYGRVALTTINQYMDIYSDRLIVVFSGYQEDIYNNLFKVQKGLESRFTNKFEIEAYTPEEMTQIFIQRLAVAKWTINCSPELVSIIRENYDKFQYFGRDMDTLALYVKNVMSEKVYEDIVNGNQFSNIITDLNVVKHAVQIFTDNMISSNSKKTDFERLAEVLRA